MKVLVEMKLANFPTSEDKKAMRSAACSLTDTPQSILVCPNQDNPTILTTTFSMKNSAQHKVVDSIGRQFSSSRLCYEDLTISFSK